MITVISCTHFCFFCGDEIERLSQHIMEHADENEARIIELERSEFVRKKLYEKLTFKGDLKNNIRVMENHEGQFIVARLKNPKLLFNDYRPCIFCSGFFQKRSVS